jgi:hypothetical protein
MEELIGVVHSTEMKQSEAASGEVGNRQLLPARAARR